MVWGYSVGSQMVSWFMQLHASGQLESLHLEGGVDGGSGSVIATGADANVDADANAGSAPVRNTTVGKTKVVAGMMFAGGFAQLLFRPAVSLGAMQHLQRIKRMHHSRLFKRNGGQKYNAVLQLLLPRKLYRAALQRPPRRLQNPPWRIFGAAHHRRRKLGHVRCVKLPQHYEGAWWQECYTSSRKIARLATASVKLTTNLLSAARIPNTALTSYLGCPHHR